MSNGKKRVKQIYLTEREIEKVSHVAKMNQISFSEQVRRILDKFINSTLIVPPNIGDYEYAEFMEKGGD